MAPHHRRRRIVASRRRVEDESEDGGSVAGELEDDSLSEGTVMSNQDDEDADAEGSETSEHDGESVDLVTSNGKIQSAAEENRSTEGKPVSSGKPMFGTMVSDTEAMLNGMNLSDKADNVAEIHFDDITADSDRVEALAKQARSKSQHNINGDRKEKRKEEYARGKESNSMAGSSQGGPSLHERRNADGPGNKSQSSNTTNRAKSKPHGLIVDSNMGRCVILFTNVSIIHYKSICIF